MEQREEELQQQVRCLRTKEATLSRTNSEFSHRSQQLETRLEVLESELSSAKEQVWLLFLLDVCYFRPFEAQGHHRGVAEKRALIRLTAC